ncbi:flagellar basal-body rod modification protein FlgD [Sphingomonas kyeonggiensis]|uniref:Basal-body rod modification protein FlgD n=1 Tax=Sphingomonas kyeonggiensis TaxID=1268553 RepID=A0A7W7K318_9SPHN|nr:flagellar hook capping FlgD N-terminal domain-containing protein [Sphingomonas kyeonggiensis]MBB4840142.1 flagellar basal-body rod modification protein FlgD [Sphingomonas kyeonggiensis]
MTTVTNTTNTAATNSTATANSTGLNADFTMFLKLLTTQMQNQDPLSPMDTSQYTQQLVQYSQVEQSMAQTSTLKDILSTLGTQNLTQASSLIGRAVEVDSPVAGLSDTQAAQWSWTTPRTATSVVATITDASGKVVDTRTVEVKGDQGTLAWDGLTSTGTEMPSGKYSLSIKALDASGTEITNTTVHSIGVVNDVQLANGSVLVTVNGNEVDSSKLIRIGNAPATNTDTGTDTGTGA